MFKFAIPIFDKHLVVLVKNFDNSVSCILGDGFNVSQVATNVLSSFLRTDWATYVINQSFIHTFTEKWTNVLKCTPCLHFHPENVSSPSAFTIEMIASEDFVQPIEGCTNQV